MEKIKMEDIIGPEKTDQELDIPEDEAFIELTSVIEHSVEPEEAQDRFKSYLVKPIEFFKETLWCGLADDVQIAALLIDFNNGPGVRPFYICLCWQSGGSSRQNESRLRRDEKLSGLVEHSTKPHG